MFLFQRTVNRDLRRSMFSHLLLVQKNVKNSSTAMTFHRLLNNSSYPCYSVKSDDRVTFADPSNLVSEQYEVRESFGDNPLSVDSEAKYTRFSERCLKRIEKALKCTRAVSFVLYKQYPLLFHENIGDTVKKITLFTGVGIPEESLVKNIEILELDQDEIIHKIKKMDAWGLDNHQKIDMLSLLKLELEEFENVAALFEDERKQIPTTNRLIYFSNILRCSLRETVDMSMEHPQLLTKHFEDTKEIFELLLDHGIRPQSLQNNLWLLDYSIETIKKWLNISNEKIVQCTGIDEKLQMTRLQNLKERDIIEKAILKPDQTRENFLAEKLQIDLKLMKFVMSQYPKIFDQNLCDLTKVIDFLYFHGYTGAQICSNCAVLSKNINFLQIRLEEFEKCGNYKLPLNILCSSKNKYETFLQELFGRI